MKLAGSKGTRILILLGVILILIVGFRVGMNIIKRGKEAELSSREKVVVVTAAHPTRQTITPKFKFSGTLDPVWQADVAAKVDGRIEEVLVDEGQAVNAGDALVRLERTDTNAALLNAEGAYRDAEATLQKAQSDYDRAQHLFEVGAISQEQLDNAIFALQNAEGRLAAAQGSLDAAQSKVGGTMVTTPRKGIIQKRYYQEGYYAKVGTALFNIADISTLLAKIDVPEGYVASIAVGGRVDFTIPAMEGSDKTAIGRITRISPVAAMPSRTFEAEVAVDNRDGKLRGGVYADATITAAPKQNVLTVPMSAISMRDDQRTVYVVEDGVAVRRVLRTGYIGENIVEVSEGISEDDMVITGGLNKVREGSKVKISKSGDGGQ